MNIGIQQNFPYMSCMIILLIKFFILDDSLTPLPHIVTSSDPTSPVTRYNVSRTHSYSPSSSFEKNMMLPAEDTLFNSVTAVGCRWLIVVWIRFYIIPRKRLRKKWIWLTVFIVILEMSCIFGKLLILAWYKISSLW